MEDKAFEDSNFDFLDSFRTRLPEVTSSIPPTEDIVGPDLSIENASSGDFVSMEDYSLGVSGEVDDGFEGEDSPGTRMLSASSSVAHLNANNSSEDIYKSNHPHGSLADNR